MKKESKELINNCIDLSIANVAESIIKVKNEQKISQRLFLQKLIDLQKEVNEIEDKENAKS